MRDSFFDDSWPAIIYIAFLVIAPCVSIGVQFCRNDDTMYLSYMVASFASTYDYLMLLDKKASVSVRLWWEGIAAAICTLIGFTVSVWKLLTLQQGNCTYDWKDLFCLSAIIIMASISMYEFVMYCRKEYRNRFSSGSDASRETGSISKSAPYI